MRRVNFKIILELGLRLYVFLMLNLYGIGKIVGQQFYRSGKLPEDVANIPLGEAEAFDLAWTFMGFSTSYILFVGVSQLVGAWLLLFNKTKLLGVAILIPIMLNIVVFDMIFLDAYGALASAILYFSMLVIILILNKKQVLNAFKSLINTTTTAKNNKKRIVNLAIAIVVVGVVFLIDQFFVNSLGHGRG